MKIRALVLVAVQEMVEVAMLAAKREVVVLVAKRVVARMLEKVLELKMLVVGESNEVPVGHWQKELTELQ
ncbi:unnamed protein product [Enterobius vermicularis]|uniref:DZF domain-containing protein n=1 Tax=Enterobius vermicularis TaxID=51028 RepID=A0A0N4V9J4_ENTVE|nr:unnamed protein product [Enterobius vermicularis]